jgi:hypothetical protein
MAHFRKAFPGKNLQAADLDDGPITATIAEVTTETLGMGKDAELKLVVRFREPGVKNLVVNLTRAEAISEISGSEDTNDWVDTEIQLVRGMTKFQGKRTPCIVVQRPLDANETGF